MLVHHLVPHWDTQLEKFALIQSVLIRPYEFIDLLAKVQFGQNTHKSILHNLSLSSYQTLVKPRLWPNSMMECTIHRLLSRPALNLEVLAQPTSYTTNSDWDGVENIRTWHEFNFETLARRFNRELKTPIRAFIYKDFRDAQAHLVNDETTLGHALSGHIVTVSAAIRRVRKNLFLSKGARVTVPGSIHQPDYGIGDDKIVVSPQGRICLARAVGETKLGWDSINTMKLMQQAKGNYEADPSVRMKAKPFEQVQHYCKKMDTRYGWIVTDKGVTVVRVKGSESTGEQSFQPSLTMEIALLEVAFIPWQQSAKSPWTPDLAVFFLALLAAEDFDIGHEYPPLADFAASQLSAYRPTTYLSPRRLGKSIASRFRSSHLRSFPTQPPIAPSTPLRRLQQLLPSRIRSSPAAPLTFPQQPSTVSSP